MSAAVEASPQWVARFEAGDEVGRYRIIRLIGHGGMGEVYEALDLPGGRRVALKVVGRHLRRADDRARFLEEGRAAAALSHPHVVYVFRAEEVAGLPAIVMELLPGRTLRDRVASDGPLPLREAVDTIRQILAGVGAIHEAGLLHRDLKPSNCLCDRTGRVKIGDFGLSVAPARSGAASPFQGTPAFAAPEQIAGAPFDARADLYAVAATSFFLLTGAPPFAARSATEILAALDTEGPPSLRERRGGIPHTLDRLLRRMLSPLPEARLPTAGAFAEALRPFSSDGWRPARPARRLAASTIDALCLLLACGPLMVGAMLALPAGPTLLMLLLVPVLIYGTVGEGVFGATVGMRVTGLRVVTLEGERPTLLRAALRSLVFLIPSALVVALWATTALQTTPTSLWVLGAVLVASAAVSSLAATRQNLYATLVDLATDTRLVRLASAHASVPERQPRRPESSDVVGQMGPYDLVRPIGVTDRGVLFEGFDPRLCRAVWVHRVDPGTPPIDRPDPQPARLRWLHGERCASGGWDVYESPGGQPLTALTTATSWTVVRRWLLTLLAELLQAFVRRVPWCARLEEIWITADGRALWLDFRPPNPSPAEPAEPLTLASAQRLVRAVAVRALDGGTVRDLPFSATTVLARLAEAREAPSSLMLIAKTLAQRATGPDRLTGAVRALTVTCSAVALGAAALVLRVLGSPVIGSGTGRAIVCLLLATVSAAACRGGFWLSAFGVAVVTADGREISPSRAALRAMATWGWLPLQVVLALHGWAALAAAVGLARLIGFAWAIDHPDRGLADRLVGTRLVVR